jgi:hypothetical protein
MKTKNNTFKVVIEDITKIKGDVVLNWTTSTLNTGPNSFYALHKAAGPQLLDFTLPYKENVHPGDAFTTIACWLPYYSVIHCIIPDKFVEWNLVARNVIATLRTYKLNNLARNLYIPVPDKTYLSEFISQFMNYEEYIKGIEFIFVCEFEWEKDLVLAELKKQKQFVKDSAINRVFELIDNFFKNITLKIFNQPSSALFSGKLKSRGFNKKEL